jgi:CMP-N-acetylneuraminic acid synthetase
MVQETIKDLGDSRIEFIKRSTSDTLRSRSIVSSLLKVSEHFDPQFKGITIMSYIPSPFVTVSSLEEAVFTLVFNNADSSMGVEEIKEPVFCRTSHGLKSLNTVSGIRTDFDYVYREANIAVATRNVNLRSGSLIGARPANFIVAKDENFFIDSEKNLEIANILDLS